MRQVTATQEAFKEARAAGDMDGVRRALHSVHETQAFWAVPTATVQRVDYEHLVGAVDGARQQGRAGQEPCSRLSACAECGRPPPAARPRPSTHRTTSPRTCCSTPCQAKTSGWSR